MSIVGFNFGIAGWLWFQIRDIDLHFNSNLQADMLPLAFLLHLSPQTIIYHSFQPIRSTEKRNKQSYLPREVWTGP